jgi:hypothetical protein
MNNMGKRRKIGIEKIEVFKPEEHSDIARDAYPETDSSQAADISLNNLSKEEIKSNQCEEYQNILWHECHVEHTAGKEQEVWPRYGRQQKIHHHHRGEEGRKRQ